MPQDKGKKGPKHTLPKSAQPKKDYRPREGLPKKQPKIDLNKGRRRKTAEQTSPTAKAKSDPQPAIPKDEVEFEPKTKVKSKAKSITNPNTEVDQFGRALEGLRAEEKDDLTFQTEKSHPLPRVIPPGAPIGVQIPPRPSTQDLEKDSIRRRATLAPDVVSKIFSAAKSTCEGKSTSKDEGRDSADGGRDMPAKPQIGLGGSVRRRLEKAPKPDHIIGSGRISKEKARAKVERKTRIHAGSGTNRRESWTYDLEMRGDTKGTEDAMDLD